MKNIGRTKASESLAEEAGRLIDRMLAELALTDDNDGFGDVILDGLGSGDDPHSVVAFVEGLGIVRRVVEELAAAGRVATADLAKHRDFCVESLWPEDVGGMEDEDGVAYARIMSEDELLLTTIGAVKAYRDYVDEGDARHEITREAAASAIGRGELSARIAMASRVETTNEGGL